MSELKDLERRAKTEPNAAMDMAERLLLGIDMKPDQKAAYKMVQQAARLGHADGRRAWVYVTAAGIGARRIRMRRCKCSPNWRRRTGSRRCSSPSSTT